MILDDHDEMDVQRMPQQTEGGGYAWEEQYKRSWDVIQEDASGQISMTAMRMQELLKRRKSVF